jgi:short-subunit dehydrogenase
MSMVKPYDGIAWVTGASSGIGLALAEALVGKGWRVGVTARRDSALRALAARHPGKIFVGAADITDRAAIMAAVAGMEAEAKAPVVRAILNAGTYKRDTAEHFSAANLREQIEVNLLGTTHCLEAIMPGMMVRRRGQIGLMASLAGLAGLPGSVSYSTTKAGLIAMAQSLKFDLDKTNVTISAICPGFVKTPLTAGNDFKMPHLMEAADAADATLRGMDEGRFLIAFPDKLAWPMRMARLLPAPLFFPLIKRNTRW